MRSKVIGWAMAILGLFSWFSFKYMGGGPLASLSYWPRLVLIIVMCWGGLLLIGRGENTTEGMSAQVPKDPE